MKKNLLSKMLSCIMTAALVLPLPSYSVLAKTDSNLLMGHTNIKTFEGKVNVGDFGLYTKIMGKGKVSVVFDSGYGDGIYAYSQDATKGWDNIQQKISKYAKTVTYDRAGLGKSDDTDNRQPLGHSDKQSILNGDLASVSYNSSIYDTGHGKTALDKAKNLHALLKAKKVSAPYLLVIHSLGSFDAVEFAKLYPHEVSGIVMVDGSGLNVTSDMNKFIDTYAPDMKDLFYSQFTKADGTFDEVMESQQQVYHAGDVLRNIPLTVVSGQDEGMGPEYQAIVNAEQEGWIHSSNYSKRIMVPNSSHYIYLDQPQYVINAIKDMIKTVECNK